MRKSAKEKFIEARVNRGRAMFKESVYIYDRLMFNEIIPVLISNLKRGLKKKGYDFIEESFDIDKVYLESAYDYRDDGFSGLHVCYNYPIETEEEAKKRIIEEEIAAALAWDKKRKEEAKKSKKRRELKEKQEKAEWERLNKKYGK